MGLRLSEFCAQIRDWTNDEGYSDALITSWVRMFEERCNHELRHKDMIKRATTQMVDDTTELPADWLELTSVRYPNCKPMRYSTEDEFWMRRTTDDNDSIYTILGNTLLVNPVPSILPTALTITYYATIPPVNDVGPNNFLDKYPRLYTFGTLALTAPYAIEDERIMVWETEATRLMTMMNEQSRAAKYSGSPLTARFRSFG